VENFIGICENYLGKWITSCNFVELERWMEKFVNWKLETELEKMHDNFQVANKIVKTTNEIF
jgi:hypothetical protein